MKYSLNDKLYGCWFCIHHVYSISTSMICETKTFEDLFENFIFQRQKQIDIIKIIGLTNIYLKRTYTLNFNNGLLYMFCIIVQLYRWVEILYVISKWHKTLDNWYTSCHSQYQIKRSLVSLCKVSNTFLHMSTITTYFYKII